MKYSQTENCLYYATIGLRIAKKTRQIKHAIKVIKYFKSKFMVLDEKEKQSRSTKDIL